MFSHQLLKKDWSENQTVSVDTYINRVRNASVLLEMFITHLNSKKPYTIIDSNSCSDFAGVLKLVDDRFVIDYISELTGTKAFIAVCHPSGFPNEHELMISH
jgi:hypothetical protein